MLYVSRVMREKENENEKKGEREDDGQVLCSRKKWPFVASQEWWADWVLSYRGFALPRVKELVLFSC